MGHAELPVVSKKAVLAAFLLFALLFSSLGYWYYGREEARIEEQAYADLSAIAALKVQQIAAWRAERLADAEVCSIGMIRRETLRLLESPDNTALAAQITDRMRDYQNSYGFENLLLVDAEGKKVLCLDPEPEGLEPEAIQSMAAALQGTRAVFSELYISSLHGHLRLDVATPILDDEGHAAAVLVLRTNPRQYLFPLIESWPTASKSAETLIVRQEGDEVIFLNELRHSPDSMLNLRIPLTQTDVPAVQAVLGRTGTFEGVDYRGIEVVTDIRPIPDSPWYMVAKVDRKEIMAGIGRQGVLILLFVLLGIALAGITVGFLYNRHQRSLYIKLYKAEAAASQHAQRFRGIFETVPVSIWEEDWTDVIRLVSPLREQGIADFEGWFSEHPEVVTQALAAVKIVDVNRQTLGMFGVRDKEQLVQSLEIVFSTPDTLPGFVGELVALALGESEYRTEMSLRRLDKSLIHVLLTMSFPEPGSDSGTVLVTLTDITARLRAEEELRKHRDHLEELVEMRSKAILELNKSLKNRSEELEAVNKELEAFSYSVSHDLKAPLRSVDGYAGFLEEDYADKLDDEGRRLLRIVRESAKEMGQLINDLLAFSRLSRQELARGPLDMEGLIGDAWEQTRLDRDGRDVELRLENLHPCWGDRATVREILANLIGNAVKFTRKTEHARITVSSKLEGDQIAYTVRDNGAGFDMDYGDKLFSVFQRLHSAKDFEGTGIGLALVKRIVQRHGGSVTAEGKVGEGAAITFTLPAREEG